MDPKIWGTSLWTTLYAMAYAYSDTPDYTLVINAKRFYISLGYMIPCNECKDHYADFLKKNPILPYLGQPAHLVKYTNMLHNAVNEKLKKPNVSLSEIESKLGIVFPQQTDIVKPVGKGGLKLLAPNNKKKNCKNCPS